MNSRIALSIAAAVVAIGSLACNDVAIDSDDNWIGGPPPPVNSCAIHCPADAPAYSGKSGAVVCGAGFSPKCQCQEASQPMAYCPVQEGDQ